MAQTSHMTNQSRGGGQDCLDDCGSLAVLSRIDDAVRSEAGRLNFFGLVVGTIKQIINAEFFALITEALAQRR